MKSQRFLALKIALAILLIGIVALLILAPSAVEWVNEAADVSAGEQVGAILGFALVGFPLIYFIAPVFGLMFLIVEICLLAKRKKRGSVIASLVILCIYLPVCALTLFMLGSLLEYARLRILLFLVGEGFAYLFAFLSACVSVHRLRMLDNEYDAPAAY